MDTPFRHRRSINTYLRSFALAVTIPVVCLACYLIHGNFERARVERDRQMMDRAEVLANEAQQLLVRSRQLLEFLASRPLVRALDAGHCDPELAGFARTFTRQAANILTLDEQGHLVCSALVEPVTSGKPLDKAIYFDRAKQTRLFTVGLPAVGHVSKRRVVTAALPILNEQGAFRGLVTVSLDLLEVSHSPILNAMPTQLDAGILHSSGVYISRMTDPVSWVGKKVVGVPVHGFDAQSATASGGLLLDEASMRLYAFHRVADSDWIAYVSAPAQEMYVQGYTQMWAAVAAGLLTLLIAIGLAWQFARRISGPLAFMDDSFRKAACGDLSVRVDMAGTSETAALARSFNAMVLARSDAERRLRGAEQRYRQLFDNINEGILVIQDGRLRLANAAARRIGGRHLDPATGACALDWVHPEDRRIVMERHMGTQTLLGEQKSPVRIFPENGSAAWMLMTSARVDWEGRPAVVTFFWDVTVARQSAQVVERSERRFRETLDAMFEGCWVIGFDWRFLYVNAAGALHARKPRSHMLGLRIQDAIQGIERGELFAGLERTQLGRAPARFVSQMQYPDQQSAWFEIRVSPVPEGIVVMLMDVTGAIEIDERQVAWNSQAHQAQRLLQGLN